MYRKSAVLYGLDKARGEIRRQDLVVIVEGNMDVIASHQFGVINVVGASGTALTIEQLALLKRFTKNLAIAFDQDAAGLAATVRGLDLARQQDFSIKIITLPPEAGKDPDDAVRKDPQIWKDAIKQAISIMEWIYRNAFRNRHPEHPEDKKIIAREVLMEIQRVADPVERDHWMKKLAKDLDVSEEALKEVFKKLQMTNTKSQVSSQKLSAQSSTLAAAPDRQREFERGLFGLMLFHLEIWRIAVEEWKVEPEEWLEPEHEALYRSLCDRYALNQSLPAATDTLSGQAIRPPDGLTPDETKTFDVLALFGEQEFQDRSLDQLRGELKIRVEAMRRARKARQRKQLEANMRQAERLGDEVRIVELLKQFEELR